MNRYIFEFESEKKAAASTEQLPFAVELVGGDVDGVAERRQVDLAAVVGPRAELHRAVLVVEREPRDVDRTRRDVDAERHPRARAVRVDDDVRRKLAVDVFVGAEHVPYTRPSLVRRSAVQKVRVRDCVRVSSGDAKIQSHLNTT